MANIILDGTTLNGVTYLDVPKVGGGTVRFSEGGGGSNYQTKTKTYTPTESQQTESVSADSGYDALSAVTVKVNAISSSYVGSGVARNDSSDLTASGATVTAPAGYYASSASKSVASGTAGTPTATKGTVSSHSVTVTPSVTNTTGYITGGTKTGTAVTVSASELVSGSETKTANGTYDVTNLAEIVVNVSGGSYPDGDNEGWGTVSSNYSVTITLTNPSNPAQFYSGDVTTANGTAIGDEIETIYTITSPTGSSAFTVDPSVPYIWVSLTGSEPSASYATVTATGGIAYEGINSLGAFMFAISGSGVITIDGMEYYDD